MLWSIFLYTNVTDSLFPRRIPLQKRVRLFMISFFLHDFIVFYEAYVKMLWNIVKLGKMLFYFSL